MTDEFGETPETLARKIHRPGRKALAELAHRECRLTQEMIAEYLGVTGPAVTKMIQKSEEMARKDCEFERSMQRIRAALS